MMMMKNKKNFKSQPTQDKQLIRLDALFLHARWRHVDAVAISDGDAASGSSDPPLRKELTTELTHELAVGVVLHHLDSVSRN